MAESGQSADLTDSRERTKKARMIKSIVPAVTLTGLAVYLIVTYLPVLQKAFMI